MQDYIFYLFYDWSIIVDLVCGCEVTKLDYDGYEYVCRCNSTNCVLNLT